MASWKRKAQKAANEMTDTKLMLEEQTSRNTLLEKKQRKFDAEINSLNEERRTEAASKEKLFRELDEVKRVKYSLEDELQVGGSYFILCFNVSNRVCSGLRSTVFSLWRGKRWFS